MSRLKKMLSSRIFAWAVVFLLLVAGVGVLFFGGSAIDLGAGSNSKRAFSVQCSDESRKAFFEEFDKTLRNKSVIEQRHQAVIASDAFKQDPNCVYIDLLFQIEIARNQVVARERMDDLMSLGDRGIHPDAAYASVIQENMLQNKVRTIPGDGVVYDGIN